MKFLPDRRKVSALADRMDALEVDIPDPGGVHGHAGVGLVHGDVLHRIVQEDIGDILGDDVERLEHIVVALGGVAALGLVSDELSTSSF